MDGVRVCVPSSSGNIGSGYDTLGIALSVCNTFEMYPAEKETTLEVVRGLDPKFQPVCLAMIEAAAGHFFNRARIRPCHLRVRWENRVPIARGLASSATLRLAVLEGLNQLLGLDIPSREIVLWGAELENSTDNVAASYYGGLTASGVIDGALVYHKINIDERIDFVAVSPVAYVETDKARTVFSERIKREDAVFTLNRGILLAMAFATRSYDEIGDLLEDKLHQPQRQAHISALHPLFDVIRAAREAGALGGYLSGSGSTIMALTFDSKEAVAGVM
ncbi:hypothetical protein GF373_01475, partial [bacterium]|nr:hypothetical protein [bacterium]